MALCLLGKRCFRFDCQIASDVKSPGQCTPQFQPENKAPRIGWRSFLQVQPLAGAASAVCPTITTGAAYLCNHLLSTCLYVLVSTPLRDLQYKGPALSPNCFPPPRWTFMKMLSVVYLLWGKTQPIRFPNRSSRSARPYGRGIVNPRCPSIPSTPSSFTSLRLTVFFSIFL